MVNFIAIGYGVLIAIVTVIGGVIIYKVWKNNFGYKIRIRRLTSNNTKVIKDAIGKIKVDKQKVPYMTLWFGITSIFKKPLPHILPIPSAEVTEYDSSSNKLIIEAWYDSARGYTYIKDDVNVDTLNKLKGQDGFRVFPTDHRTMLINQIYKRDAAKPKTMGEIFVYMTPFIALIMILTIFLIFYGKAVEPISTMASQTSENLIKQQEIQKDSTQKLDNLFRNIVNYERGQPLEQVITAPGG